MIGLLELHPLSACRYSISRRAAHRRVRADSLQALANAPLANSYRYSYYPGAHIRQADPDSAKYNEQPPSQPEAGPRQARPSEGGALPFWYPEDGLYNCRRDALGLCIVDPILCPDQTYHQEIEHHYQLQEKLGEGSFGTVYAARDRRSGESVACKSVKKAGLEKGTKVDAIRQEVQIMHLVAGHRNVVNIKAAYEDENHVHIVMDLCRGGHLLAWLEQHGPLNERTAARMTYQMAHMLHHCHSLRVIHRDIKPENFLLTEHDIEMAEIKAADFGLSKLCEPGQRFEADMGGTPYYLAPEQIEGEYDCKADLWGLGVTLYECLSARPPFMGEVGATDQVLDAICTGHLDLHTGPWRNVSDAAKDLILQLLHRSPEMRASAADVLAHPWLHYEHQRQQMEAANEAIMAEIEQFSRVDALKQLLLRVVGRCLPHREVMGAERLFQVLDRDLDGRIALDDLRATARRGHWAFTREELERSIAYAEATIGGGSLSFDDFVASMLDERHLARDWLLSAAFRHLDADRSGAISAEEMDREIRRLGMHVDGIHEMMVNGPINYEHFCELVRDARPVVVPQQQPQFAW